MRLLRLLLAFSIALGALPARADDSTGRIDQRSEVLDRPIFPNQEAAPPAPAGDWCAAPQVSPYSFLSSTDAAASQASGSPGSTVETAAVLQDPCAPMAGPPAADAADPGYRLTVDGRVLNGEGRTVADDQRCQDVRLADAGIRIQSDEHAVRKVLAVDAWPDRAWAGEPVDFTAYWNYSHWIKKAEVRLFPLRGSTMSEPVQTIPLDAAGRGEWTPPADAAGYRSVLRVYDERGRFDETAPYDLLIASGTHTERVPAPERERNVSYGHNHLLMDRIPISGARVIVSGDRIKPGNRVFALGREAPLTPDGAFAVEEILPPGRHDVAVRIDGPNPLQFLRPIYIAEDRWFYVALADLTVGADRAPANAAIVTQDNDHYGHTAFVDGHAAFYLKGEIQGSWILTASADTREQPLNTLFTTLDDKDPQYLLRKLDPDQYYPVYGDDSTMTEDAPSEGKFYVRLERGESRVLWGNYTVRLQGGDLVQIDRALYGADAHLVTDATTKYGERKGTVDGFVGDPGTLAAREEFLGTGGSLYYLRHLDITIGSDIVTVEVRDKDSGIVEQTTTLTRGQDYDIDTLQGRIVLSQPLSTFANDGWVVRSSNLSGDPVYLVVNYEYQATLNQITDFTSGARASAWLGDHVQVGATGISQPQGAGDTSSLGGVDATLRYTPATYIKAEAAQSRGPGTGAESSEDGGFNFSGVAQSTVSRANAAEIQGAAQFSDIAAGATGHATAYWKGLESGFAGPGQLTAAETEQFGGTVSKPLPGQTEVDAKFDQSQTPGSQQVQTMDVSVKKNWGADWATTLGERSDWRHDVASSSSTILSQTGELTTVALQQDYNSHHGWSAYGFGQASADETATRTGDSRYGLGGKLSLSNTWTLSGEGSDGQGNIGAKIGTEARVNDRTTVYTNYQLDSDRTDTSIVGASGQVVAGVKTRYADNTTIFGEERYQNGGGPTSLTHAYGLDVAEQDGWHWGVSGEQGTVADPTGDISRLAATASVGITHKDFKWTSGLEYRDDQGGSVRHTWMTRNSLSCQVDPNWRLITKFSFSLSPDSSGDLLNGQYTEGIVGWAYRPVDNDRLNALFKYTYFTNEASPGQITDTSATPGYSERSNIISADATYDLFPKLSIGGKYAFRLGEVQDVTDGSSPWLSSTSHLFILRLDYHVVRQWDAVVEGRQLRIVEAQDVRTGALLALYRQISKNLKFGGGYNFTDYSDDLTDLSYRSHGVFVNVLANF